jgi:hypothetical protein
VKLLVAIVAGLLVVSVTACSGDDDPKEASNTETPTSDEPAAPVVAEAFDDASGDFYAPPDPLPDDDHGTLMRYKPLADQVVEGSTAYRVMYLSESLEGEPIAVTGTVLVPDGEAPAEGWKLLTVAHGTSGNADECAPSKNPKESEAVLLGGAMQAGYVVAITDYEGLGTPGRHPYLVGPSEGRSVLDAALAARQLPDTDVGDRYGIVGYSQGGHGAAWAHDISDDWAPDLELVGTVAGAPPSEMSVIFNALAGNPISADFFFMIVAGYAQAYPEADPALVLTSAGIEALDGVDHGCFDVSDAIGETPWSDLVKPGAGSVEPWPTLLKENDPGQVATDSPMLIVHSSADTTVPAGLSEAMFNRLCGLGQTVERRVYDEGQNHVQTAISKAPEMFAWIEARMAGEPAMSTCP